MEYIDNFPVDLLNLIGQYCDLYTFLTLREGLLSSAHLSFKSYFRTAGVISVEAAVMYNNNDLLEYVTETTSRFSMQTESRYNKLINTHWIRSQSLSFLPVDIACGYGNINAVKLLYDKGERPSHCGAIWSVINDNFEMLKYLHTINAPIPHTCLREACYRNRFNIIRFLYSIGLKFDSGNGKFEIQFVFQSCSLEILKLLLCLGERMETHIIHYVLGEKMETHIIRYVDCACVNKDLRVIEFLYSQGYKATWSGMLSACAGGHSKMIEYLHTKGLPITSQNYNSAVYYNNHQYLIPLLERLCKQQGGILDTANC